MFSVSQQPVTNCTLKFPWVAPLLVKCTRLTVYLPTHYNALQRQTHKVFLVTYVHVIERNLLGQTSTQQQHMRIKGGLIHIIRLTSISRDHQLEQIS